jgi:hypothetical protein
LSQYIIFRFFYRGLKGISPSQDVKCISKGYHFAKLANIN